MVTDKTCLLTLEQTLTNKTLTAPKLNEDVELTATSSELNTACDGITATAAEINTACDGITATAAEINTACDGITATASEINTACDGITATAAELNQLDDVEVGGSASGDIVDLDTAQTMENKTLTSPVINGTPTGTGVGISDNNIVAIDHAFVADNDYAKFTPTGLEGRSFAEVREDLDLEIGTDVLAQQTIGIANDNLVEMDDAYAADNDFAKFTANGLEGRSYAEVRSDLGGISRMKTGSYSGDDSTSQAITGVGFQPKYLKITGGNGAAFDATDGMVITDSVAVSRTYTGAPATGGTINSLDADGFTVDDGGGNNHPNKIANTYYYIALG